MALDHQECRGRRVTVEKMALDDKGFRNRPADRNARGGFCRSSRSARTSTCRCSTASGLNVVDGTVQGSAPTDDRRNRHLRRRRHGAVGTHRHRSRSAMAEGRPSYRRLAARQRPMRQRRSTRSPASRLNAWYYGGAEDRCARRSNSRAARKLRRSRQGGWTKAIRCTSAWPVLRPVLRMRQLLWRMSRQFRDQARPGQGFEFNYDFCKGCGLCAAECPCSHLHGAGSDLKAAFVASPSPRLRGIGFQTREQFRNSPRLS